MISDYVVAVSLAEADFAQALADKWIASGEDLRMPAGWSCYCWLLGNRPDTEFDLAKLSAMLDNLKNKIHDSPDRTKVSMTNLRCRMCRFMTIDRNSRCRRSCGNSERPEKGHNLECLRKHPKSNG